MDFGADRREARRFTMSLPVCVLVAENQGQEVPVQMRDVSYRGLYFFAADKFEAGKQIAFVITLPENVTNSGNVKIRCHGEVVRVEPSAIGNVGIAARIERYEFISSAAAA